MCMREPIIIIIISSSKVFAAIQYSLLLHKSSPPTSYMLTPKIFLIINSYHQNFIKTGSVVSRDAVTDRILKIIDWPLDR